MQMFGVRGLGLAAALTFGAVVWWASRGTNPAADGSAQVRVTPASHASAFSADTWLAPADKDDPADAPLPDEAGAPDASAASDESFTQYVLAKYHFLLESPGRAAR